MGFGADDDDVVRLQQRLEDPQSRAEDVSRVLPEAITIRSQEDMTRPTSCSTSAVQLSTQSPQLMYLMPKSLWIAA